MWGTAGQVAAWSSFLAAENDNQFAGWFDAAGVQSTGTAWRSARGGSSGVLEGSAEVAALFGSQPQRIAFAGLRYATANGGGLRSNAQVPASIDGNGNAESGEWTLVESCTIAVGDSCCPGDLNGNGAIDGADLTLLVGAWGSAGGDLTGDGQTDGADLSAMLGAWGACP